MGQKSPLVRSVALMSAPPGAPSGRVVLVVVVAPKRVVLVELVVVLDVVVEVVVVVLVVVGPVVEVVVVPGTPPSVRSHCGRSATASHCVGAGSSELV